MDDRFNDIERRMEKLEDKVDTIMEMVTLGKHIAAFAKLLGWLGGAYLAVETYVRTFGAHK